MASIYELSAEFMTLWDLMENGELDDEAFVGAFDCAKEDLAAKIEGYCKFIKNLESDIEGLKAEEARLAARRKTMENTVKRSKDAIKNALNAAGEKKLPCGTFTVAVQANSAPSLIMDEQYLENIPVEFLTYPEPVINTKLITDRLKADEHDAELEGIAHLERGEHIRIR